MQGTTVAGLTLKRPRPRQPRRRSGGMIVRNLVLTATHTDWIVRRARELMSATIMLDDVDQTAIYATALHISPRPLASLRFACHHHRQQLFHPGLYGMV